MFLFTLAIVAVALICGPIWLVQRAARGIAEERAIRARLSPAEQAERAVAEWRKTGRSCGLQLFWAWCLFWGSLLVFGLWALMRM